VRLALLVAPLMSAMAAPGLSGQERSGTGAWAIEAAGGSVGSLAGFGAGVLFVDDDCGDDLDCILDAVGTVLLTASTGSTLGAWAFGKMADTNSSLVGAALGSLAGAAAGLGVIKLIDEAGGSGEGAGAVIGFSVAQEMVTALGSRIGAALR
jgi:hypothetical protein